MKLPSASFDPSPQKHYMRTLGKRFYIVIFIFAIFQSESSVATEVSAVSSVRDFITQGRIAEAKAMLFDCADAQNAECQFLLAQWIERGELYQRDVITAKKLYELSYSNGYEKAGAEVLRLTKESARLLLADEASKVQVQGSNSAANVKDHRPISEANADIKDSVKTPVEPVQESAPEMPTWLLSQPKVSLKDAPDYFGIRLDELSSTALKKLSDSKCDWDERSVERECNGSISTASAVINVTLNISQGRVYIISGKAQSYSQCEGLATEVKKKFGQPKFLASKLVKTSLRLVPENSLRGATTWVWGNENWVAMYFQFPGDSMCSLSLSDARMSE